MAILGIGGSISASKKTIIAGLDVGSAKISVCVGQYQEGTVDIISLASSPSAGLRKGAVVDIEETTSRISQVLDEAEQMCGCTVSSAVIGVSGSYIDATPSRGVIAISRADGEITDGDVERVLQAARVIPNIQNKEILHVIPRSYTVDGVNGIYDPVGMTGIRLEADVVVVSAVSTAVKNLTRCVFQAGIDVQEIVYAPLALAKTILSDKQKELGVAIIDFGAQTTDVTIFEEGEILHTFSLPLGSNNITNDIAIGLRTSIEIAEKIKIQHGVARADQYHDKDIVELSSFSDHDNGQVSLKYVSEIIEARLNEILMMIRDELRKINRDGTLPAGVVITGGGSQTKGILDLVKDVLRLPAQLGQPIQPLSGMVDKLNDPIYATSVGLMNWNVSSNSGRRSLGPKGISDAVDKAKGFFKQFLP